MAPSLEIPAEELATILHRGDDIPWNVLLERAVPELSSILHSGFQAQEKLIQLQGQQAQHQFDQLHDRLAALEKRVEELGECLDLIRSEQRAFLEGKVPIALAVSPEALRLTQQQQEVRSSSFSTSVLTANY
jgi:hypothetical protein